MSASLGHVTPVLTPRDPGTLVGLLDDTQRPVATPDRVRVYQLSRDALGPIWAIICGFLDCDLALVFTDHGAAFRIACRHAETEVHERTRRIQ